MSVGRFKRAYEGAYFMSLHSIVDPRFDNDGAAEAFVALARRGHVFSAGDTVEANSGDGRVHLPTQYLPPAATRGRP